MIKYEYRLFGVWDKTGFLHERAVFLSMKDALDYMDNYQPDMKHFDADMTQEVVAAEYDDVDGGFLGDIATVASRLWEKKAG